MNRSSSGALMWYCRRVVVGLCALAVGTTAGCTGADDAPGRPDAAPTAASPTVEAVPPASVRVTRVAGTLRPEARKVLAERVGEVVGGYLAEAYLAGPFPRTDYRSAFADFTRGAARAARRHETLLTHAELGPTTVAVRPLRQRAYLSVLAPRGVPAGVTARVDLRYLAEQDSGPARTVTVTGRLLLTRAEDGGWAVFGYDLDRSVTKEKA